MPSIYCHYLSGDETLKSISSCEIKHIIKDFRAAFNLGTQGGDIFFYYEALTFKRSGGLNQVGGKLHDESISSFFQKSLEYISTFSGRDRNILLSYVFGYICHYSLDGHTHPFIFYKSGFNYSDKKLKLKYEYYHRRFETALDVLMLDNILKKQPKDIKPWSLLSIDNHSKKLISDMYCAVLDEIYSMELSSSIIEPALSSIVWIQRMLFDRSGFKKKILSGLESFFGQYPLISSAIHSQTLDEDIDYLNLKNKVWHCPWNTDISRTDSFLDMFKQSVSESASLCEDFFSLLECPESFELHKHRWNNSFYTGLDCSQKLEFLYFKAVYDKSQNLPQP